MSTFASRNAVVSMIPPRLSPARLVGGGAMTDKTWAEVDNYLAGALLAPDPVLDDALADSAAAGLPRIAVAPNQGKLLNLLARQAGARSILEIGTLGGYSTIWLARALPPGGKLVTCEY